MRVLVVEDDPGVATFVGKGLAEASYTVDMANNGVDGFRLAQSQQYDCVVLDLMLPGKDGFSIIRDLREKGISSPIICLTARDGVDDRVRGLNLGADDYLPKPFSFSELLARIHALLRRGHGTSPTTIVVADLTIDLLARTVHRAGKRIDLSVRESALIEYLARNSGRVLSRTMILEHVWGMNQDPLTNVIDVHINRLRKKVDIGFEKCLIHTIRGVGYVLREDN
jgi:two-component system, OmpR family, response regulator